MTDYRISSASTATLQTLSKDKVLHDKAHMAAVSARRPTMLSIIVPTFHEAKNLRELTQRVFGAIEPTEFAAELIIVDDDSQDGTEELCRNLASELNVRLIVRKDSRGLSTAVLRGMSEARGDILLVMDADLSHPPEAVPEIASALLQENVDFVIGSRYVSGGAVDDSWSFFRKLNSRIATWLAIGLTNVSDPMAGFFALRRTTFESATDLNPCGFKIGLELLVRCGCKNVEEVPIRFEDRLHGSSKLNLREQWLYLKHLARLYGFRYSSSRRFLQFACVGASGLLVDLLSFHILMMLIGIGAARASSIWVAMTWNFELNRRITFARSRPGNQFFRYIRFCAACSLGGCLSWLTTIGLIAASYQPTLSALAGAITASVVNFALCRTWVFPSQETDREPVLLPINSASLSQPEPTAVRSAA